MIVLEQFLARVVEQIVNPIILLLVAGAFVTFLWGVYEFIKDAGDAKARETGKRAIYWGLIGLVVMFGAYGIINVALRTFNIDQRVAPLTIPR